MAKCILSRLFSCASPSDINGGNREVSTSPRHNFSCSLMEENVAFAESIIAKWDSDSSNYSKLTSLFAAHNGEASRFLRALTDLRRALLFFSSSDCPDSFSIRDQSLIRAQKLMQTAMRRLEKEFHHILSTNRQHIDSVSRSSSSSSSSSDEDDVHLSTSDTIADLRSIAESMMANGYGMECIRIYKLLRKSILEEALFLLGFDVHIPFSNIHKIDWPVLDLKIKSWLAAARISFTSHFAAERLLCNHVFDHSTSDDIDLTESCFADVTSAAALQFLSFPESIAKTKPSREKLFSILELHQTLYDLYPNIESTFSYESTAAVKEKALEALQTLADAARDSLAEFELAVQKESSKIPVPGGGVHPLIRNSMNYLVSLVDHVPTLINVYAGIPFRPPEPLPEMSAPCPSTIVPSSVSERVAWLLLVILCKLDHKAEFYKEVSFSYLFLANNVQYVVNEVKGSGLSMVLGARWVDRHEKTARRYLERYVRYGWAKAAAAFEEAAVGQEPAVVEDERMREEVKVEVEGMILPAYGGLYESLTAAHGGGVMEGAAVRFSPEDLRDRIEQVFVEPNGEYLAGSLNRSCS
ncbi:exocyst complex component EXO70B1-like [Phalaenopsis equestris]|uniref:exocyst complex component EXO70B1-like n=1 Tax=Phalaenopsis equestris TaxID=78828 RepID=UPI0009E2994C|nr:exocyst complex component EXO70B1-like [Phalaenopsis equestris]